MPAPPRAETTGDLALLRRLGERARRDLEEMLVAAESGDLHWASCALGYARGAVDGAERVIERMQFRRARQEREARRRRR